MFTALRVAAPPASEPVDVSVLRAHLRVDSTNDDALLGIYLPSARALAEQFLGRALMTQTLVQTLSQGLRLQDEGMPGGWPAGAPNGLPMGGARWGYGAIELARAPAQSVSKVALRDCLGVDTILDPSTYFVDLELEPGRLKLDWPLINSLPAVTFPVEHVQITFVAGYASADAIPPPVVNAILLIAAFLYERRGDAGGELPGAAEALLWPYRIVHFGA